MERRKFVLSAGALAASGGIALGTGAFSTVEAERDVGVAVSDDSSAYLGIEPGDGPNGNYVDTTDSDALAINLTGDNDNIGSGLAGGEGLNANAVTGIADLFKIQNQGTQEVQLEVAPLAFADADFANFDGVLGVLLVPQIGGVALDYDMSWTPPVNLISLSELSPGDEIDFSLAAFAIPESAVDSVEISDEIEITAEEL
ncbi:hypothetical protein [Natrinema salsiterrestre]|uniref:DUF1102 domain-containing protein n=1 Tax=Natrinema salsiterrestre TaxID=2950540 RepID=A0A9Q4L0P8_9EURY|nr:hypothetical protein [Natrinema salsiterrestre]MDF9744688.1 hypothetical protein [Natrinema salsiterrestre]